MNLKARINLLEIGSTLFGHKKNLRQIWRLFLRKDTGVGGLRYFKRNGIILMKFPSGPSFFYWFKTFLPHLSNSSDLRISLVKTEGGGEISWSKITPTHLLQVVRKTKTSFYFLVAMEMAASLHGRVPSDLEMYPPFWLGGAYASA